ncbi:unnamed protein product, partial [Didymodactylos carnosus]
SRLERPNQLLFNDIVHWDLNTTDFPNFVPAIDYSCSEPEGWCYKTLHEKASRFGKHNIEATYLRITMGVNEGNSPGHPYVLEIWPPGHYSPIHVHSNSYGIIRVLHGKITTELYSTFNVNHQIPFATKLFQKDDVTWLSPGLNQIHRVINTSPNLCITIQAYQYGHNDQDHYEYFDYIKNDRKSIGHFDPKSDMDYVQFKKLIKKEWVDEAKNMP